MACPKCDREQRRIVQVNSVRWLTVLLAGVLVGFLLQRGIYTYNQLMNKIYWIERANKLRY